FQQAISLTNLATLLKEPATTIFWPADNPWYWTMYGALVAQRQREAQQAWSAAINRFTGLADAHKSLPVYHVEKVRALNQFARYLSSSNQTAEAEAKWQQAYVDLDQLAKQFPDQLAYQHELAIVQGDLGVHYQRQNRYAPAVDSYLKAIGLLEEIV